MSAPALNESTVILLRSRNWLVRAFRRLIWHHFPDNDAIISVPAGNEIFNPPKNRGHDPMKVDYAQHVARLLNAVHKIKMIQAANITPFTRPPMIRFLEPFHSFTPVMQLKEETVRAMMVEQEGTHRADWAISHSLHAHDADANADLAFILGRQPPCERASNTGGPRTGPPYAVVCLRLFVKTLRP